VNEIRLNRYGDWNWNYGESPDSQVFKERRYTGGKLQIYFDIVKGCITNFKIYGDFLHTQEISPITIAIEKTILDKAHLFDALEKIDFNQYFFNITKKDLVDCIMD
jgi:lipoate-protein ligase A